jgi:hypothetical protein
MSRLCYRVAVRTYSTAVNNKLIFVAFQNYGTNLQGRFYKIGETPPAFSTMTLDPTNNLYPYLELSNPSSGHYTFEYKEDERGIIHLADMFVHPLPIPCLDVNAFDFFVTVWLDRIEINTTTGTVSNPLSVSIDGVIFKPAGATQIWYNSELNDFLDTAIVRRDNVPCTTQFFDYFRIETDVFPLVASETHTNCTAIGVNDGTITVVVSGGSGSYSFLWDDGPTTQNRTGLAHGNYSVTVTDNVSSEVVVLNISILQPAPPVYDGSFIDVPILNSLHFVNEQIIDQCGNPQALDNVLLIDQVYPGFLQTNYFQKVCVCDQRLLQFNSDFSTFSIRLHKYCSEEIVKNFSFSLKEQNLNKTDFFEISIRNHVGFVGKSRVYFDVGPLPIPLKVGDVFTVTNNLDGFNGSYSIIEILNDTTLGYQFLVINATYTPLTSSSEATGQFYVSTENFNVFESLLSFNDVTEGDYYVRIVASNPVLTMASRSEPIEVRFKHEDTNEVVYRCFDNSFNMTWSTGYKGVIRVESLFGHKRNTGGERTMSRNSNFSVVKLAAKKFRGLTFEVFMLPPYMHEKLGIIFDNDFITINGVQVQATDAYSDPQYIERFLLANASIKLELIDSFDKYNSNDIGTVTDATVLEADTVTLLRTKE